MFARAALESEHDFCCGSTFVLYAWTPEGIQVTPLAEKTWDMAVPPELGDFPGATLLPPSWPRIFGAWVSGGNDVIQRKVISVKTKRTLTSLPALQVVKFITPGIKMLQNLPWKNDHLP